MAGERKIPVFKKVQTSTYLYVLSLERTGSKVIRILELAQAIQPTRRTINIKPELMTPCGPQQLSFGCMCFI